MSGFKAAEDRGDRWRASLAITGGWQRVKDGNVRRLADDDSEETGVAVVSGVLLCLAREGSGC